MACTVHYTKYDTEMPEEEGRAAQFLADHQLSLFQPGRADYAHHITTSILRFLNSAESLMHILKIPRQTTVKWQKEASLGNSY